jgi:hypothetical protein
MIPRALLLSAVLSSGALAQVGYPPSESPYRDANLTSRMGLFAGYYRAAKDPAGVFPQSGPLIGARLDVHVGGPGDIAFRITHIPTKRNIIDPTRAAGERLVEVKDVPLTFADVGLSFNLTGAKSWHNLMPIVHGSVGIVTDFGKTDVGGFAHGSTFSIGYGIGMRYVPPKGRLGVRADAGSHLYSLQYPLSYYTVGGDGTAVLATTVDRSSWRNNWTLSAGLWYQLLK